MTSINFTDADTIHAHKNTFDPQAWLKKASRIIASYEHDLSSVVFITGYLLVIASLTLASVSGGFPWFLLTLVFLSPLFALMASDGHSQ
ncbi:MAG: hypothetical protein GY703_11685 [Gammaproteobacteria bacterium]|nr:hypothetical protein [Gammaproteobacteria bacterium]